MAIENAFRNFMLGHDFGQEQADRRSRRNALAMYDKNPEDARAEMIRLGDFEGLGNLDEVMERDRLAAYRRRVANIGRGGAPQPAPTAGAPAPTAGAPPTPASPTPAGAPMTPTPQPTAAAGTPTTPTTPTPPGAPTPATNAAPTTPEQNFDAKAQLDQTMQGLANSDPQLQQLAQAALEFGDMEAYVTLLDASRQQFTQGLEYLGARASSLLQIPDETQRFQAAINLVRTDPMLQQNAAQLEQQIVAIAQDGRLSNAEIESFQNSLLTVQQQMELEIGERRWQAEHQLRVRTAERESNPDYRPPLSTSERRVLANEYRTRQDRTADSLGILRPALPYARLAVAREGDTQGVDGVNARQADVALLRAAARAQTGPGVLTESEVWSTLSPSLQQSLLSRAAYLDVARTGIDPADRLALANFVMQSAGNVQRQLWDDYDSYSAAWGEDTLAENGMTPPRLAHPDDEWLLAARERQNPEIGREYVANNGRTYRYEGPGNWVFSRTGGTSGGETPTFERPSASYNSTQPTEENRPLRQHPTPIRTREEYERLQSGTMFRQRLSDGTLSDWQVKD